MFNVDALTPTMGNGLTSGAGSYVFSSGNAIVSPTINTSYSVTGTSSAGCVSTLAAVSTVTVHALPTVTASGGVICSGSAFSINPGGAINYTYSGGSSVVSPTITTSYSVSGSNSLGCVSQSPAVVIVTVNALPIISVNSGTVCSGANFTINASGAQTYTYSSISNIISPTINTTYSVTGTNSNNCVSAGPAVGMVTVIANPTISVPSTAYICVGDSYTINPTGALSYTYSGGSNVVNPSGTTVYTVTGTSSVGCVGMAMITVSVQPSLTVSITGPSVVCEGQSIILMGNGANTYTWNTGSTSYSIVVTPSANTVYTVNAGSANCAGSATQSVMYYTNPTITAASSSSIICADEAFTLTAYGANTYTWSNGNTGNPIVVTATTNSTYSVIGTDANGCTDTTNVSQVVDPCVGFANIVGKQSNLISVYPNPNNGQVVVNFGSLMDNATIQLYNYLGQLILEEKAKGLSTEVNFNSAANGVYTIRVISSGNTVYTNKLIKQE